MYYVYIIIYIYPNGIHEGWMVNDGMMICFFG